MQFAVGEMECGGRGVMVSNGGPKNSMNHGGWLVRVGFGLMGDVAGDHDRYKTP